MFSEDQNQSTQPPKIPRPFFPRPISPLPVGPPPGIIEPNPNK